MEGYVKEQDLTGVKFGKAPRVVLYNCINIDKADFSEVEDWSGIDIIGGVYQVKVPTITNLIRRKAADVATRTIFGFMPDHSRHLIARHIQERAKQVLTGAQQQRALQMADIILQRTDLCWDLVEYINSLWYPDETLMLFLLDCFKNQPLIMRMIKIKLRGMYQSIPNNRWEP